MSSWLDGYFWGVIATAATYACGLILEIFGYHIAGSIVISLLFIIPMLLAFIVSSLVALGNRKPEAEPA